MNEGDARFALCDCPRLKGKMCTAAATGTIERLPHTNRLYFQRRGRNAV